MLLLRKRQALHRRVGVSTELSLFAMSKRYDHDESLPRDHCQSSSQSCVHQI
jgi:hypothetical protein